MLLEDLYINMGKKLTLTQLYKKKNQLDVQKWFLLLVHNDFWNLTQSG